MGAANGFAMCGLLFWVGNRYFNAESPLIRSFSEMSYTVYLVHWPTMVVLNRILLPMNLPVAAAFSILVIVTGAISIGFYWYLGRRSDFLTFFMNGQRARPAGYAATRSARGTVS
jgi:peptidoglycan/LPS O-acetylase OafA/YrhL